MQRIFFFSMMQFFICILDVSTLRCTFSNLPHQTMIYHENCSGTQHNFTSSGLAAPPAAESPRLMAFYITPGLHAGLRQSVK